MDKLKTAVYYLFLGIIFCLLVLISLLNHKIKLKEEELLQTKIDLSKEQLVNRQLKIKIYKQNKLIEKNKILYDKKIKEYENYKNLDDRTKYKDLNLLELKSNECEDIEATIDNLRYINF